MRQELLVSVTESFRQCNRESAFTKLSTVSKNCIEAAKILRVVLSKHVSLYVEISGNRSRVQDVDFNLLRLDVETIKLVSRPKEFGYDQKAEKLLSILNQAGIDEGVWTTETVDF